MAGSDLEDWIAHLGHELKWLSGDVTGVTPIMAHQHGWTPRIDLLEGPGFYLVRAELAGVRGADVQISYNPEQRSLSLKGQRLEAGMMAGERCAAVLLEIECGEFSRDIGLPDGEPVNYHEIKIQLRNGLLFVLLPLIDETESVVIEETLTIFTS